MYIREWFAGVHLGGVSVSDGLGYSSCLFQNVILAEFW